MNAHKIYEVPYVAPTLEGLLSVGAFCTRGEKMQELYDSHVHSHWSPDSKQTFSEIYDAALKKGLQGLTITDHADLSVIEEENTFESIASSVQEVQTFHDRYKDAGVQVFCGVELSEYFDNVYHAKKILEMAEYDAVIASVHWLRYREWDSFYSRVAFDDAFSEELLHGYLAAYFEQLLCVAEDADYDVLAHLTCPLRYINGKYKRGITLDVHRAVIDEILRCVIRRGKALEINTSGIGGMYESLMPDLPIIQRYYDLGGRQITLGSDAHTPERVGNAFAETIALLSKIGFSEYVHYEKRQPKSTLLMCM